MKLKNLLISSVVALGLAASVGVALKASPKAEAASATSDDTMITVVMDFGEAITYSNFHEPMAHYWGTNVDKYEGMHLLHSSSSSIFVGNLTIDSSEQTISKLQFKFRQEEWGDYEKEKWSVDLDFSPSASYVYHFSFNGWEGSNFKVEKSAWNGLPRIQYYGTGDNNITQNFAPELGDKSYKATIDIKEAGFDATDNAQIFFGAWGYGALRDDSVSSYTNEFTLNSFEFKEAGKYDIFIYNTYEDGGIMAIKKYSLVDSYVYYLSEANFGAGDTPNYVYTYGGTEQYGSFPGSTIASVASEVTGRGILRFGGNFGPYSDQSQYIYKIPVKVGYPGGDDHVIFKSGTDSSQTANYELVAGSAYTWNGGSDLDAGKALDFLVKVEAKRNAVTASGDVWAYSVCGISKGNAADLWNEYDGLDSNVKAKVDSAEVYTYQKTAHEEGDSSKNGLISYADVMDELARIGQVGIYASPSPIIGKVIEDSSTMTFVIIAVVSVSAALIGVIFIIRKRKVQ